MLKVKNKSRMLPCGVESFRSKIITLEPRWIYEVTSTWITHLYDFITNSLHWGLCIFSHFLLFHFIHKKKRFAKLIIKNNYFWPIFCFASKVYGFFCILYHYLCSHCRTLLQVLWVIIWMFKTKRGAERS